MSTRPTPATRAAFPLFRSLQTRWMDNDVYGHLNNVVHYALFDTAVNGWLIEQGLVDPHHGTTICLVVETGCSYFAEMRFPDAVTAGIRVAALGTSSIRYDIALFRNDDEIAAAQGRFTHVHVDRATRRPVPLNVTMRGTLATLLVPAAD